MATILKTHGLVGRKQTPEHIEKRMAPQRGRVRYPNGRIFSEEHRARIVAANKGQVRTHLHGVNNPRWKGGHKRQKNGYVLVYIKDHPSSQLYVLEHRLVMEQHLGRSLLGGENVHHRNGVRNDNRIENLELWVNAQPSGIRIADAVAWAKEILNRYEKLV